MHAFLLEDHPGQAWKILFEIFDSLLLWLKILIMFIWHSITTTSYVLERITRNLHVHYQLFHIYMLLPFDFIEFAIFFPAFQNLKNVAGDKESFKLVWADKVSPCRVVCLLHETLNFLINTKEAEYSGNHNSWFQLWEWYHFAKLILYRNRLILFVRYLFCCLLIDACLNDRGLLIPFWAFTLHLNYE